MAAVLVVGAIVIAYALWTGNVGIYGGGVGRTDNPPLYWAQVGLLVAGELTLALILLRG